MKYLSFFWFKKGNAADPTLSDSAAGRKESENMDYIIKETNQFNNEILGESVAAFGNLPQAREYVDIMAARGKGYTVTFKGEIVYPND